MPAYSVAYRRGPGLPETDADASSMPTCNHEATAQRPTDGTTEVPVARRQAGASGRNPMPPVAGELRTAGLIEQLFEVPVEWRVRPQGLAARGHGEQGAGDAPRSPRTSCG
jgi:hypothetical protein